MIFAVFNGFGGILMVFIDQNLRIHGFSMLSVKNPRILSQILFKTKDFGVKSIFFENFLRNDPKFVFLWKIIILGLSKDVIAGNIFRQIFGEFSNFLNNFLLRPADFWGQMQQSLKNQHT